MKKKLTSGSVLKNIIYFSLPYLLSYFLQTLYGMADLFIIGQFNGVDSTTAVSIGPSVPNEVFLKNDQFATSYGDTVRDTLLEEIGRAHV